MLSLFVHLSHTCFQAKLGQGCTPERNVTESFELGDMVYFYLYFVFDI